MAAGTYTASFFLADDMQSPCILLPPTPAPIPSCALCLQILRSPHR